MQHTCFWMHSVQKPIQFGGAASGPGQAAFDKLNMLLRRLMLRRTKVERADDLGLPPRVVNIRRDYFTEEEEELYQSLFRDVRRKFNTYADEGTVRRPLSLSSSLALLGALGLTRCTRRRS